MDEKDYDEYEFELARKAVFEELDISYNESVCPCTSEEVYAKCEAYIDGFKDMTDEERDEVLLYWAQRKLEVAEELISDGGEYSLENYAKQEKIMTWNGRRDVYANAEDWMRSILEAVEQITDEEASHKEN